MYKDGGEYKASQKHKKKIYIYNEMEMGFCVVFA